MENQLHDHSQLASLNAPFVKSGLPSAYSDDPIHCLLDLVSISYQIRVSTIARRGRV